MNHSVSVALMTGLFGIASVLGCASQAGAAEPDGPRLTAQQPSTPELGEGTLVVPQQSTPAERAASADDLPPQPGVAAKETSPAAEPDNRQRAIDTVVQAQEKLSTGNYEEAVRLASQAVELDQENAAAYKKVRATAYAAQGKFEEALADSKPLELTVTAPNATIRTDKTVLATVPAGTKVTIDDVKGNWLKVAAVGDQTYKWGWVRKTDVQPQRRVEAAAAPQGEIIYEGPVGPGVRGGGPYRSGSPHYNYGRDYYDYWRHVPPQYWRFLPR